MNKNGFSRCADIYIGRLREEGRYSTAHVYQNALLSFSKFCGVHSVSFRQVTRERLRRYEQHLYECGLKPNTISTYMRMLRSIYNRGVEAGSAPYVHRLFHEVYTGVDVRQKRALPVVALRRLLYEDPQSDRLRRTQAIAALMFQFCGMSFADLSHLEKSALDSNVLRYNRVKTKTPMSVEVLDSAQEMLDQLRNRQSPRPGCPDYLFGILHGDKKRKDERAYREYQSALRRFNYCLKSLAKRLRLNFPVTSYTLRHSWATTAKYRGVPIEMISESLGHKSIKTTQIYLKGFEMAVKEGKARSLMTSYNPLNGHWTASNYDLCTTVLRGEWGYEGIVMTDWWAKMNDPVEGGKGDMKNTAAMVRAQNDLYMVVGNGGSEENIYEDNTLEALESGNLSVGELQRCAMNICRFILESPVAKRPLKTPEELEKEAGSFAFVPVKLIPEKEETMRLSIEHTGRYKFFVKLRSGLSQQAQSSCNLLLNGKPVATVQTNGTGNEWNLIKLENIYLEPGDYQAALQDVKAGMEIAWVEVCR